MPKTSGSDPTVDTPNLAVEVEKLSFESVDRLSFGAIKLDRAGAVIFISQRERELSGRGDRPAIGLDFFTEIAPLHGQSSLQGPH